MNRDEAFRVLRQMFAEVPKGRRKGTIEQALGRPLTAAEAEAIPELYRAAMRIIADRMARTAPQKPPGEA